MVSSLCKSLKFIAKHDNCGMSPSDIDIIRGSLVEYFGSEEKLNDWIFEVMYDAGCFDQKDVMQI